MFDSSLSHWMILLHELLCHIWLIFFWHCFTPSALHFYNCTRIQQVHWPPLRSKQLQSSCLGSIVFQHYGLHRLQVVNYTSKRLSPKPSSHPWYTLQLAENCFLKVSKDFSWYEDNIGTLIVGLAVCILHTRLANWKDVPKQVIPSHKKEQGKAGVHSIHHWNHWRKALSTQVQQLSQL